MECHTMIPGRTVEVIWSVGEVPGHTVAWSGHARKPCGIQQVVKWEGRREEKSKAPGTPYFHPCWPKVKFPCSLTSGYIIPRGSGAGS